MARTSEGEEVSYEKMEVEGEGHLYATVAWDESRMDRAPASTEVPQSAEGEAFPDEKMGDEKKRHLDATLAEDTFVRTTGNLEAWQSAWDQANDERMRAWDKEQGLIKEALRKVRVHTVPPTPSVTEAAEIAQNFKDSRTDGNMEHQGATTATTIVWRCGTCKADYARPSRVRDLKGQPTDGLVADDGAIWQNGSSMSSPGPPHPAFDGWSRQDTSFFRWGYQEPVDTLTESPGDLSGGGEAQLGRVPTGFTRGEVLNLTRRGANDPRVPTGFRRDFRKGDATTESEDQSGDESDRILRTITDSSEEEPTNFRCHLDMEASRRKEKMKEAEEKLARMKDIQKVCKDEASRRRYQKEMQDKHEIDKQKKEKEKMLEETGATGQVRRWKKDKDG